VFVEVCIELYRRGIHSAGLSIYLSVPCCSLTPRLSYQYQQESRATAKMTAQCALYMGVLKIFDSPGVQLWLFFSKFATGFCSNRSYKCVYKNLKFVPLPVPEIIGGTLKTLGSPWICSRSLFSKIYNGLVFGWIL